MIPPARYDVPLIRVLLTDSSGNPVTGLTAGDTNMRIGIARDNGGSVAVYGASNILSIATIGTYVDPGSSAQCRFGAVDATNFPGLYELQFNQAFLSSARSSYVVRVWDVTATPRWQPTWCAIPIYMPVRVDHVRDTLQTSRDLGAQLDVAVSTRSTLTAADVWGHASRTLTGFGTLVSDVASAVWSAGTRTLTSFGTLASDVWSAATRTLTSVADSSGVTTLLSRLTSQRATNLDNLDAAVSSRLASSAYQSPPSAGTVADAVWDEPLASHQTAGSTGEALQTAGSGGLDPSLVQTIENTAAIVQSLSSEQVVRQPLVVGSEIRVARGYDYTPSAGRTLALSSEDWPDLTAATVRLVERDAARTLVSPMTVVLASPTGAQTVRLDLTAAQTSAMPAGRRLLRVAATLGGGQEVDLADVVLSAR